MNYFQGLISPVEYLTDSSDKTHEIGDSKRALTWMGILSAILIVLIVIGAGITGGAQGALIGAATSLAASALYALVFFAVSAFVAFIMRLLGGDTTWGNYFCTSMVSGCLMIIPAIVSGVLVVVFGPESVMAIIVNLIYLVIAIIYAVAAISASGALSIGKSIMAWIISAVLLGIIFFVITLVFGAMIAGLVASSGMLPY